MITPFQSIGSFHHWVTETIQRWRQPLIIIAVLSLSVGLPVIGSQTEQLLVVAAVVSIIGGLVLLRWWQLGLIAIPIAGMLVPFTGPSGLNASAVLVALIVGVWILKKMLQQKDLKLAPSITTRPLLFMLVMATISFGFGQLPWYTFVESAPLGGQLGGLGLYFLSAGAFLLVAQLKELRWLKWMVWIFLALGALVIIGRLVPGLDYFNRNLVQRGATDSLFWTWLVALAFSQAFFNKDLSMPIRLALGLLTVATVYAGAVLANGWKSGWIPPLVVIAAIIGLYYWRISLAVTPWLIVPLSTAATYVIATDKYSWETRVDAWLIVAEITKINPLFGLGFGNYRFYTPLYPIRGWAVEFNSHSQYVDIYAQAGIIGLICFLWFFCTIGWLGWQLRDRVPSGFSQAYVFGALGGWTGTLVAGYLADWIIPFFYNVGYKGFRTSVLGWLFLGGLVMLDNKYRKHKTKTSQ